MASCGCQRRYDKLTELAGELSQSGESDLTAASRGRQSRGCVIEALPIPSSIVATRSPTPSPYVMSLMASLPHPPTELVQQPSAIRYPPRKCHYLQDYGAIQSNSPPLAWVSRTKPFWGDDMCGSPVQYGAFRPVRREGPTSDPRAECPMRDSGRAAGPGTIVATEAVSG